MLNLSFSVSVCLQEVDLRIAIRVGQHDCIHSASKLQV